MANVDILSLNLQNMESVKFRLRFICHDLFYYSIIID